jgi:hypothetical protein
MGKEEVKLLICKWHDLIPKDPETATKKLLDIINSFNKVAGYKINLQKSVASMNSSQLSIANNEQTKKEYRKIIPFPIASKKKKQE